MGRLTGWGETEIARPRLIVAVLLLLGGACSSSPTHGEQRAWLDERRLGFHMLRDDVRMARKLTPSLTTSPGELEGGVTHSLAMRTVRLESQIEEVRSGAHLHDPELREEFEREVAAPFPALREEVEVLCDLGWFRRALAEERREAMD